MKILHITTSNKGGAGVAAVRLHNALVENGVDSKLLSLVQFPSNIKEQYLFRPEDCSAFPKLVRIKLLILKILKRLNVYQSIHERLTKRNLKNQPKGFEHFSFPYSEYNIGKHPLVKDSDIIHLHWVSDGFLDYERFFRNCTKKLVWTLHDMNPFTGGCHHSDGCIKFETTCSICPQLKNTIDENFSAKLLVVKKKAFSNIDNKQLKIVTPSEWLANLSKKSNLFQRFDHHTIYNGVNTEIFKINDKIQSRKKLGLPEDKKILLFVSHTVSNLRKGINYLVDALSSIDQTKNIMICSVGAKPEGLLSDFKCINFGYISDEQKMAEIYSAADVFVLPSIAENFPNTICEALLCGTPVVAFNVGGIPEQINHSNGRMARLFNAQEFKNSIVDVLKNQSDFIPKLISERAKEQFDQIVTTNKYIYLYNQLLNQ